jgi:predicted dehydrogenase
VSTKEVGIGLFGYSIGRVHAYAWTDLARYYAPPKLRPRLVAIGGRTKANVDTEAKRFGFAKTYYDWENLVKDPEVEVFDNCAPPAIHAPACIAAAELGKDIVCEKPLARRASEAKQMLDVAEKQHVKHMVGYNYRFLPAMVLLRNMIKEGALGKVNLYKGAYLNTNGGFDDPNFPFRWNHSSEMNGYGAVAELGSHAIDLARFLVGDIKSVSGVQETFIKERPTESEPTKMRAVDVDDTTLALMRFKDGALGSLEASWIAPGRADYLRVEVYGSLGSARFNMERPTELEVFQTGGQAPNGFRTIQTVGKEYPFMKQYWPSQGGGFAWAYSFVNELNHFVERLAEDRPVGPEGASFLDGYKVCSVLDAIAESNRTGRWSVLPE